MDSHMLGWGLVRICSSRVGANSKGGLFGGGLIQGLTIHRS